MADRIPATLEPYLVLPENRFAHASALAAVNTDDGPTFLYGVSGAGKSFLVRHAMAQVERKASSQRVGYFTGSEFAARFAEASSEQSIPKFQSDTRKLNFMFLEDLQALEGRPETQIQLVALIDHLLGTGCRILWTASKSPGELERFTPRLINRFRGAVLSPLPPLGKASRSKLIGHFAQLRHVTFSAAAQALLAEEYAVSPRELAAAVQRLAYVARQDRASVDSALVRKFLAHDIPPPKLKLDDVCRAVSREFGVTVTELRSRKRHRGLVLPRQCAMSLARELTGQHLGQIGKYFGGRDHSTVIHACQRIQELLAADSSLKSLFNQLRYTLGAPVEIVSCE